MVVIRRIKTISKVVIHVLYVLARQVFVKMPASDLSGVCYKAVRRGYKKGEMNERRDLWPGIFLSPSIFSSSPSSLFLNLLLLPRILLSLASIGAFVDLMTEGMMTRTRTVDEQLVAINEQLARHDFVFTKVDSLCATVQQHSDSFEQLRKNHSDSFDILRSTMAAQQSVMAEIMVKLQQLGKGYHLLQ